MGRLGDFSENSTSRANFRGSSGIREAQAITTVMANSGAFSGLDKGLAQPEDTRKPDKEEIQGSMIENRESSGFNCFPHSARAGTAGGHDRDNLRRAAGWCWLHLETGF